MTILDSIAEAAQALKEQLSNLLEDELGTLSNGEPAIWIGQIPNTLKTTGLQVEIQQRKEGQVIPMGNHQKLANQAWKVDLINFADSPNLIIAVRKIESNFIIQRTSRYLQRNDLTLEKCACYIWAPDVYNKL